MLKIKTDGTIHCSRGDAGNISLKIPYMDKNGYYRYKDSDTPVNYYWYDKVNNVLYDDTYTVSQTSLATLTQDMYQFQVGDTIDFVIYEKNGYDRTPMSHKHIEVESTSDSVTIELTGEDTTFGEISNKPTTYWYDITLNDTNTIICYNEDGAREFIIYPAIGEEN
jgi:hypothetical protein